MELITNKWNNWYIISISGQFVLKNLTVVRTAFEKTVKTDETLVLLNLSEASHIDSSAITLLLNFSKRIKTKNGKLLAYGANKDMAEIFSIVGLDRIVPLYSSFKNFQSSIDKDAKS